MIVGCLAGCSTAAASQGGTSQLGTASPPMTEESEQTKEQNVVCPDLLIAVDVSGLETREQKADVEKAFETCGWIYDGANAPRSDRLTGVASIETYYFMWERFGDPVYPQLPAACRITENPLV